MKQFNVKLTKSEISHLHGLIIQNEDSQTYYGNWEQYCKRQDSIKRKFLEALSESQSVSDNEQQKRSCKNCKYVDGFRCKHPDNCECDDLENWEQL